jgi:hypothetical protein
VVSNQLEAAAPPCAMVIVTLTFAARLPPYCHSLGLRHDTRAGTAGPAVPSDGVTLASDDPSFIVLTETKFSFRCIPVWEGECPKRPSGEKNHNAVEKIQIQRHAVAAQETLGPGSSAASVGDGRATSGAAAHLEPSGCLRTLGGSWAPLRACLAMSASARARSRRATACAMTGLASRRPGPRAWASALRPTTSRARSGSTRSAAAQKRPG